MSDLHARTIDALRNARGLVDSLDVQGQPSSTAVLSEIDAILAEHDAAAQKPMAYVPVDPVSGPMWWSTVTSPIFAIPAWYPVLELFPGKLIDDFHGKHGVDFNQPAGGEDARDAEKWRTSRTHYDSMRAEATPIYAAGPRLLRALTNLMDALNERTDQVLKLGIESIVFADARQAIESAKQWSSENPPPRKERNAPIDAAAKEAST